MPDNVLPALVGALAGGVVTMLGWFANYYFSRKKELESRRQETRLEFLQQQIEEFYAPLWSLIEQSKIVHEVARKRLPVDANGFTDHSKFTDQDNEIFRFFNETYYLPLNSQIAELIRKKIYLLDHGILPESFTDFIRHQVMNESLYRLWKEKGIDSRHLPGVGYPVKFNDDVKSRLDILRQRYQDEIAMYSKSRET